MEISIRMWIILEKPSFSLLKKTTFMELHLRKRLINEQF